MTIPSEIDPDLWRDWCADRRKRGKPITERGAAEQLKALATWIGQGLDANYSIREALAGGYQGLFPPKNPKAVLKPGAALPQHRIRGGDIAALHDANLAAAEEAKRLRPDLFPQE